MTTLRIELAYLLELIRQVYQRGFRDGHAAAEAEMTRAAAKDQEDRIRVLESAKAKLIGAAVTVTLLASGIALVGGIATLIELAVTHH